MPKKLLFFIESLDVGGAEKSLTALLNSANFENFKIDLMMLKKGTFFTDVPPHVNVIILEKLKSSLFKRIKFYILNKTNPAKLHSSQNFWTVYKNEFKKVENRYDVAISYSQGFSTYFIAERVQADKKYAWVNIDYKKAGYNIKFDLPFYKKFNKVIAVSADVDNGLSHELKNIGEKLPVKIIKDITDVKVVREQALIPLKTNFDQNVINIVTVCRLVKQKGLYLAVEACAILTDRNFKVNWYVVGEGAERKSLEKLVASKNLQKSFFLMGADPNPYPYMQACDIYVQTSLFEGLGLTVIEAACLHKPIVSTDFPTIYGIIKDGETGLIAEMNAESIADKIQLLMENSKLRDHLVSNLEKEENKYKEETLCKIENLLKW